MVVLNENPEQEPRLTKSDLEQFIGPRPGGHGRGDIWVTTRAEPDGKWGVAVNLGEPVNSPFHEADPNIFSDGLSLYFNSNRSGGIGASDIWVSTRASVDDDWGEPVNLGPTVNGRDDDVSPEISADGRFLFFSSERSPNLGFIDIWVTTRATISDPWGPPMNLGQALNTQNAEWSPALSPDGSTLFFAHWLA